MSTSDDWDGIECRIDMDLLAALIEERGVPAYVGQTGGGTATILIGNESKDQYGDLLMEAMAGPGWFEGPGWTVARGRFGDFYWGLDDQGESDPEVELTPRPLAEIADGIVEFVKRNRGEVQS